MSFNQPPDPADHGHCLKCQQFVVEDEQKNGICIDCQHRELLEMSAKAYGIELEYRHGSDAYYYDDPDTGREQWVPTDDDGQALRLAVALSLRVEPYTGVKMSVEYEIVANITDVCSTHNNDVMLSERHNCDPMAATRLAITRAAAEIGKAML